MRSAVRRHVVVEALELLPAPGVGLLEVDRRAEEVAAGQGVVLAPDGLLARGPAARARRTGRARSRRRPRWPRAACSRIRSGQLAGRRRSARPGRRRSRRPRPSGRSSRGSARRPRRTAPRRHLAAGGLVGERDAVALDAAGTAASRASMWPWASPPSVGIRSKTWRIPWRALAITDTCCARCRRPPSPARGDAARGTSPGPLPRARRRASRPRRPRPRGVRGRRGRRKPAGERSGSRSSCPATPK